MKGIKVDRGGGGKVERWMEVEMWRWKDGKVNGGGDGGGKVEWSKDGEVERWRWR